MMNTNASKPAEKRALFSLIFSMFVFGTIGIFRKYIPLSSGVLAMARGFIGAAFLLLVICVKRERMSKEAIRRNLLYLIASGLTGFYCLRPIGIPRWPRLHFVTIWHLFL